MGSMSQDARSIVKALRDGALVIASILIAFGLEAWWANRGLQRDLSADLASVREQLHSVRQTVESQSRRSQRIIDVGNQLVERLADERTSGVVTVPDTVVFWAVSATPIMNISMGAVDALIASGRFGAIRSTALRTALGNLDAAVSGVTENQETAREYSLSVLSPRIDDVLDGPATARLRSLPSFPFVGRPSESLGGRSAAKQPSGSKRTRRPRRLLHPQRRCDERTYGRHRPHRGPTRRRAVRQYRPDCSLTSGCCCRVSRLS